MFKKVGAIVFFTSKSSVLKDGIATGTTPPESSKIPISQLPANIGDFRIQLCRVKAGKTGI